MFDKLDDMLKTVADPVADALRYMALEQHVSLSDSIGKVRREQSEVSFDAAKGILDLADRLTGLEQNRQQQVVYAPPGLTDPAADAGAVPPVVLPGEIAELVVDEETGALKYKMRRTRHVMGSLMTQAVDADYTTLTGLGGADARLQSGASAWQLARWDPANSKWVPWNLGAAGEYLKSNGAGVAPAWGAIPLATTSANGLLRQLPASGGYSQFMNGVGNWRSLSMGDWYTGSANHYDMLRLLPIYGAVDPETGEPTILGWDWQPFAPDMDDLAVWYGGDATTAADDPLLMLIARPVSNGDDPETFTYQGESMTIAEALMGMSVDSPDTAGWPKYLRQVSDGEGGWNLEWEDLCDQDGVPDYSMPYWSVSGNEIRLKYLPKGTDGQVLTSGETGDPGWAALPAATTSKAGVIGPLPSEAPTTKYLNGAGAFVAPGFAAEAHNHDGVYAPVHSHPYALDDHTHPFADLLDWMTEAATAADDPWQLLVMKPVSNGDTPETWSYQTSTETIADALTGMSVDAAPTDGWPKYLRMVQGPGHTSENPNWLLEWEDLCDQDGVPDYSMPYWSVSGSEIRLKYLPKGTDGQVLTSGETGDPGWAALPDAAHDKKGVIQLDTASATTKYLNGAGAWTTPPNTNTWPGGGTDGHVWTSQGPSDEGAWEAPAGFEMPAFAADDFPQMLVGEMSEGEEPAPVHSWKTIIKQVVDGIGEGVPLDKSIMLWDDTASKLAAYHPGPTRSLLWWDGNEGLKPIGAATADKQVLRWNFDGATSVGPSWAANAAAAHASTHVDNDPESTTADLIPIATTTKPGLLRALTGSSGQFLNHLGQWGAITLPAPGAVTTTVTLVSDVTYDTTSKQLRKFTRLLSFDASGRLVSVGAQSGASLIEQAVSMLGA